ncbi:MAG: hypothetical protein IPG45_26605 [Deltaproteobacteria bacterium]|nr:hypothetical protein [Deltaproteobacteria bacterium]
MADTTAHRWRFVRVGGINQVQFRNAEDLLAVDDLDPKLWMALSLPVKGVVFDKDTLELIDSDKDGRVRATELIAAVKFTRQYLKDTTALFRGGAPLPITSINDRDPAGQKLLAAAKRILINLGKSDAGALSVDDVAHPTKIFAGTKLNGDGIVTPDSTEDAELKAAVTTILDTVGGEADRSGKPGINQAKADTFFKDAQALVDWQAAGAAALTLGDDTAKAHDVWAALKAKVEDYFLRCRVAAFDGRAEAPLNGPVEAYAAVATRNLDGLALAALPLAKVEANRPLPLSAGVSPSYTDQALALRDLCVRPILGKPVDAISEADWRAVCSRIEPYATWLAKKPGSPVEKLGMDALKALTSNGAKAKVDALIAEDAALAPETAEIDSVIRLVRYHRDLKALIENYVSFDDFYEPKQRAIFQYGTLYLDGRATELCFLVDDVGKHSALAAASKMYLAYCEITRVGGEKKTICACFTAGLAESLWVGRNGIFFDREGKDWDAVIIKVVEAQISLKEAFWNPWRKISKMIGDQINKILASKEAAMQSAAQKSVDEAGTKAQEGQAAAPVPAGGAAMASAVAAIGIGLGFLSTAIAGLMGLVLGMPVWKTVLGIIGLVLVVSGPSVAIAYFKLRARDLAAILNAGGWAINGQILLSLKLGRMLTREASLPDGAERSLTDPYADDNSTRNSLITLAVILILAGGLWYVGALEHYFPVLPDPPADAPKLFHEVPPPTPPTPPPAG